LATHNRVVNVPDVHFGSFYSVMTRGNSDQHWSAPNSSWITVYCNSSLDALLLRYKDLGKLYPCFQRSLGSLTEDFCIKTESTMTNKIIINNK